MYWNDGYGNFITKEETINRNMRCIEIRHPLFAWQHCVRLIETWDVLKSKYKLIETYILQRLIETWDVLKSYKGGLIICLVID